MRRGPAVALSAAALLVIAGIDVAVLSLRAVSAGGRAELLGVTTWDVDAWWFHGQSGLYMAPDGGAAIVVNDRGTRLDVRIDRDDGAISRIEILTRARLKGPTGRHLPSGGKDSEGVAMLPGGRLCVSFEGLHRVRCYDRKRGPGMSMPEFPGDAPFRLNAGIEALAADSAGRLYAIPELGRGDDGFVPVYRLQDGAWSVAMRLRDRGRFRPVGADIVDGDLYLLERAFSALGFSTRLIRISLAGGVAETLLETGPGRYDNLEGLSLWRDGTGRLIATMISDDNDNWFQRTEIVEYVLPE